MIISLLKKYYCAQIHMSIILIGYILKLSFSTLPIKLRKVQYRDNITSNKFKIQQNEKRKCIEKSAQS